MNRLRLLMPFLLVRARTLIVMLVCAVLPVMPAAAQGGTVTINAREATLESVLESIERQTDYRFFYSRDVVDVNTRVSLKVSDMALPQALDELFAGSGIKYVIDRKQVVLSRPAATASETPDLVTVRGNVRGSDGEPLIGVSVTRAGMAGGATTDINGDYEIRVPAGTTLTFSYVGCAPVSRKIAGKGTVDVTLADDSNLLNEVVVVGYGVQKKRLVTGATLNIKGDDIQRQNTTSALGALYSSVPGVSIVQNNGQPDAGFKVNIRGIGTTGSSEPLYVVDGIAGADINSLNPADIESVDILKDAASCAIYGSRAANGVVLVTTRQGGKGRVRVSYDGYYSIQRANLNGVKSVSAGEYIDLLNKAFVSKGTISDGESIHDWSVLMPKQYALLQSGAWNGTDWLAEFVNNNAPSYNNAVTVDGGNDMARFSLGFTNTSTEGTLGVPKPPKYNRTTVRLNTDFTIWRRGDLE
ncbi:MAG: TonB-dependent receptor plug domain-containing protein, partial [Muribaculaceae bacterium]|nr:TonB-dependent receptor plug domain-containing protein [Muribaculaceae bacterium]